MKVSLIRTNASSPRSIAFSGCGALARFVGPLAGVVVALFALSSVAVEVRAAEPVGRVAKAEPKKKGTGKPKKKRPLNEEVKKGVGKALGEKSSKSDRSPPAPRDKGGNARSRQTPPRSSSGASGASGASGEQSKKAAPRRPSAAQEQQAPPRVEDRPVADTTKAETPREVDERAWQGSSQATCKDANVLDACDGVQTYLDAVSKNELEGGHEVEARRILAAGRPKLEALRKDDVYWKGAGAEKCRATRTKDDCVGVELYQAKYPAGLHVEEATRLLQSSGPAKQPSR